MLQVQSLSGLALVICCLFYLRKGGMQSQCLFLFPYHAGKSSLYSCANPPGHQLNFQVQWAPNLTRKKKNLQKPPVISTQCCHIPWVRANKQHGAPTQLILWEREGLYCQCQKYKSSISAEREGYAAGLAAISYHRIAVNAMHVFFRPSQQRFTPCHHYMIPTQPLVQDPLFCCFSETCANRY